MNKKERKQELRFVRLLQNAAEAHEDLAAAYSKMGWDVSADRAEIEAREFRRRIYWLLKKKRHESKE